MPTIEMNAIPKAIIIGKIPINKIMYFINDDFLSVIFVKTSLMPVYSQQLAFYNLYWQDSNQTGVIDNDAQSKSNL